MKEARSDATGNTPTSEPHIPPPTDPYITYQTPYPRRSSDDIQNPFIEFRRLADAAFSSIFAGLPKVLGTEKFKQANIQESDQEFVKAFDQHAKEFENRIAEMVRNRAEEAEGFRKKLEQEWEEKRRENEQRMEEETQKWEMMRRGLEKCPGLQSERSIVKREAETELDLYDGLKAYESSLYKPGAAAEASRVKKCSWKDKQINTTCPWSEEDRARRGWFSGLGWDGKRRAKNIPLYAPRPSTTESQALSNADWQEYHDEAMDPFNHDDHVVPWLKLSPYSPLSLIASASGNDALDQLMSEKPWDEAFEDLMSVHKTGQLPSLIRRLVYWGGPNQWMTDMALRGSLGPNWEEGFMVAALMGAVDGNRWKGFDGLKEQCRTLAGQEFRPTAKTSPQNSQQYQDQDQDQDQYREDSAGDDDSDDYPSDWVRLVKGGFEPRMWEVYDQMEELAESVFGVGRPIDRMFGARGMPWPSPEEVIEALSESSHATNEKAKEDEQGIEGPGQSTPATPQTWSTTSVSNSSWSTADDAKPDSLVSTLTTTSTRTLPDGSLETKRILKKRFADGREENSESTEIQAAAKSDTSDAGTQTVRESKPKRESSKGGWFWN